MSHPEPKGRRVVRPAGRVRGAAIAVAAVLVVAGLGGCGADAELARQEAQARANTCVSLEERHRTSPVTIPSIRYFLAGAAERSDSQRSKADRQRQNATEIKAECKRAVSGGVGGGLHLP